MDRRTYTLGYHLVAFIDVLGQRERFRELRMPKSPEGHAGVAEVLRHTAGFVVQMRELFQRNFAAFEKGISKERLNIKCSVQPRFVGFSDSFVVSVPLRKDQGDLVPILSIFSALWAASVLILTAFQSRHALRGGIDVGLATEIGPAEIYGTALEQAYLLESRRAVYPRIVIGSGLRTYLSAVVEEFEKHSSANGIQSVIEKLTRLISTDADGEDILDYLGPIAAELINPSEIATLVQPAYQFVTDECQRLTLVGDDKLMQRYSLLRSYFESRLPQFGIATRR